MNAQLRAILNISWMVGLAVTVRAAGEPSPTDPNVCWNTSLRSFVMTIDKSCQRGICDPAKLASVRYIDDQALYNALASKEIRPVRIFFPQNVTDVKQALDWGTMKRRELLDMIGSGSLEKTAVFVLGSASQTGTVEVNQRLSRERMQSVQQFLEGANVNCKSPRGGYFGSNLLQMDAGTAAVLGIPSQDYREDKYILNQSVFVFVYPCAHLLEE